MRTANLFLKKARLKKDISFFELSKKTSMSPQYLWNVLNGKVAVPPGVAKKLSKSLGVELKKLKSLMINDAQELAKKRIEKYLG